jgi:uncharacterized membrane protein
MNTVLYNVGIMMVIVGSILMVTRRQKQAEVETKGVHIRGREGFVLMVLGFLTMASASWT